MGVGWGLQIKGRLLWERKKKKEGFWEFEKIIIIMGVGGFGFI